MLAALEGGQSRTGRSGSATRSSGIGVGLRGHAGVALAHRLGARAPRGHGVGHRRPAARPRRGDHAVDPRRAAHRGLRGRVRQGDRRRRRTARASADSVAEPAHEVVLERGRPPRSSTRSTRSRSSPRRKTSFVDGANWAYTAGIIAIVLGAALVFFMFPKHDDEQRAARRVPRRGRSRRRRHPADRLNRRYSAEQTDAPWRSGRRRTPAAARPSRLELFVPSHCWSSSSLARADSPPSRRYATGSTIVTLATTTNTTSATAASLPSHAELREPGGGRERQRQVLRVHPGEQGAEPDARLGPTVVDAGHPLGHRPAARRAAVASTTAVGRARAAARRDRSSPTTLRRSPSCSTPHRPSRRAAYATPDTTASATTQPNRKSGPFTVARRENSITITAMIGTGLIATPNASGSTSPIACCTMSSSPRLHPDGEPYLAPRATDRVLQCAAHRVGRPRLSPSGAISPGDRGDAPRRPRRRESSRRACDRSRWPGSSRCCATRRAHRRSRRTSGAWGDSAARAARRG